MIGKEDLKEMEAAFEEGKWDGMWTADLLAEVKRLRERIGRAISTLRSQPICHAIDVLEGKI